MAAVLDPGRRNFTQQILLTYTFNYLFGSSGLGKQQFQAFANI
jgi:hypothetical protein